MRLFRACLAGLAALGAAAGPLPADEVDDLVQQLRPPARFAAHQPRWSVRKQVFTFEQCAGPEELPFWLVLDGDRYVAVMPLKGFHSGTVYVRDFRPGEAPTALRMPAERWHIDTSIGSELRTNNFLPEAFGETDASYEWKVQGPRLVLVRRYQGSTAFNRWAHRTRGPVAVDAVNTVVFHVDPVLGYVVDATFDVWTDPPPKTYEYTSAATSGRYALWPGEATCYRYALTPPGGGFAGYACNHGATKQHGGDMRCREGGFVACLNDETGWSPTTVLARGGEARLVVCGAHTDHDFVLAWPPQPETRADGLKRHLVRHRLLALPPELTKYVWNSMTLLHRGERRLMLRFGVPEDFEDQPLPIDGRLRGMPWAGALSADQARSGRQSLFFTGACGHGDPQAALKPATRYRLQAWLKVLPLSAEEQQAAEAKERARLDGRRMRLQDRLAREKDAAKRTGLEAELAAIGPFEGLGPAEAWIEGRYYEWSPHSGEWLGEPLRTPAVRPGGDWQQAAVEFTTPKWGPFIQITFYASACKAYLDDFAFVEVRP